MTTTPRGAPELASAQAVPETTVNEQVRRTEGGAGRYPIADRVTAPPGSCTNGAQYIIIATATGAFAGKEGQIAQAVGTNAANGWYYRVLGTIDEGVLAYVQDEDVDYKWSGSAWVVSTSSFTAASTTEQLTGTDATKGSTPDSVAALWEQGSDVSSSGTISLGEGGYFFITGTTTITDIDFGTDKAGRKAWVKFAGILTLTHNASTLILPGGANITTAAGDTACFVSEGSDVVRCVAYQKASGAAISGGTGTIGGSVGSTDNRLVRSDGTGGATVQSTGITVDDSDKISLTGGGDLTPASAPSTTSIGYLGAPQNIGLDSGNVTLALTDCGKHVYHTDGNARDLTIPANGSVAFPVGTVIAGVNENGAGVVTLKITTDTLRWGSSTGQRTIAANATFTLLKVASTTWRLTGDGIT